MFPKDLVVFLEPHQTGCGPRLEFAAGLAKQWSAHLIATFVTRPLVLEPHLDFAVGPALGELLAEYRSKTEEAISRARAQFEAVTHRRSFTAEWRLSKDQSGDALMLHARHASFAVLGPPAQQYRSTTMLGLSERVILASGRPSLLVPEDWPADRLPRRIVVAWNGGREATSAIAAAMPFLVAAESVQLLVVLEDRIKALFGQDPGADMAAHLARQGVPVELDQRSPYDTGEILLNYCTSNSTDLLVMGAMSRTHFSEVVFGGVTQKVLGSVTVPVLVSG